LTHDFFKQETGFTLQQNNLVSGSSEFNVWKNPGALLFLQKSFLETIMDTKLTICPTHLLQTKKHEHGPASELAERLHLLQTELHSDIFLKKLPKYSY